LKRAVGDDGVGPRRSGTLVPDQWPDYIERLLRK